MTASEEFRRKLDAWDLDLQRQQAENDRDIRMDKWYTRIILVVAVLSIGSLLFVMVFY
jgi:ATP-dependent protease HslVU (ClpYQ) peptidase subunit